jgi:hypothetical protein
MVPEGFRDIDEVMGCRCWLCVRIPGFGEFFTGKIDGKLGTTLGTGADLYDGMTAADSATRDAEKESRKNQKRDQAFHH